MEINCLKLEYLLRVSWPNHKNGGPSELDSFLKNSFSLLKIARSSKPFQGRDLCYIIVLALLRILLMTDETYHKNMLFMQIICLLESFIKYEPNDRQILLLISRLYGCLGFGSAHMCQYNRLRIKDVLNEPLAYILYTRISLNHPYPFAPSDSGTLEEYSRDPNVGAARIIGKYASAIDTVTRLTSETHKNPVYNRISEYADLKRKLNGSRTKQIVVLEQRRMNRIRDEQCGGSDLHETGIIPFI